MGSADFGRLVHSLTLMGLFGFFKDWFNFLKRKKEAPAPAQPAEGTAVLKIQALVLKNVNKEGKFTGGKPQYHVLNFVISVDRESGVAHVKGNDIDAAFPVGTKITIGSGNVMLRFDRNVFPAAQYVSHTHGILSYSIDDNRRVSWYYEALSTHSTYVNDTPANHGNVPLLKDTRLYIGLMATASMLILNLDMSRAF